MDSKRKRGVLRNFFSLAPYYVNFGGHSVPYQESLDQTAKHFGMNYECLLPPLEGMEKLPFVAKPFFKSPTFLSFFRGLISLFQEKKQSSLYFLECFGIKDLFLLSSALFFMKKKDRFVLLFRRGLGHHTLKKGALKMALWLLRKHPGVVFLTDSEIIAKQLGCQLLPIPHTKWNDSKKERGEKIICYWPGIPRAAKGLKEIEALSSVVDTNRFELVAARSSNLKNATLIPDHLDESAYFKRLGDADVILLPYDPQVYAEGTSGILTEAICLGKIPLVKEGSYLAYELRKFDLERLIINWDPDKVFEKVDEIIQSKEIQSKLEKMRSAYQAFHNQKNFNDLFGKIVIRPH